MPRPSPCQFSEAGECCIVAGSPIETTGCVLLHARPPRRRSRRSAGRSGAGGRLVLERARPRSCSLPLPGSFPSRKRAAAQESRPPPFSAGLRSLPRLIRMMHTSSDSTIPAPCARTAGALQMDPRPTPGVHLCLIGIVGEVGGVTDPPLRFSSWTAYRRGAADLLRAPCRAAPSAFRGAGLLWRLRS
jgi:hypothetical protein